jgi:hypothetical protein
LLRTFFWLVNVFETPTIEKMIFSSAISYSLFGFSYPAKIVKIPQSTAIREDFWAGARK